VREAVLPGYTVFSSKDASVAAGRMFSRGSIRVKQPLEAGGRGQTIVNTRKGLHALLKRLPEDEIATTGLVLEENLEHVTTLSVGHIVVDDIEFAYHGSQRLTTDNNGRSAYGGSDLICVRGGWDALNRLSMNNEICTGVKQARLYDEAMREYPGFMASRRNYDVGQGVDQKGERRSGVWHSGQPGRHAQGRCKRRERRSRSRFIPARRTASMPIIAPATARMRPKTPGSR
jgi:Protein of unknown function (DUF3182)